MNAKNLSVVRRNGPYQMDPKSDRFRVCPNDGVEFMAKHRSTRFCCDKCADEFHNQKKKGKSLINSSTTKISSLENSNNQHEAVVNKNTLRKNISIIEAILGQNNELKIPFDLLKNKGFVYEAYDDKIQYKNTDGYIAIYGRYAIGCINEKYIILTYKDKLTWIQ
jgi:hypothetical protein